MAVLWVREHWEGRSGDIGVVGDRTATRTFVVRTNNENDTEQTILDSGLLPTPCIDVLPENGLYVCQNIEITNRESSAFFWDVEVTYSDEALDEGECTENPLNEPIKIRWNSVQYEQAIARDINNFAIINSAFDPFDPPPTKDDARWSIQVKLNVSVVPSFVLGINNAINDSPVVIDGIAFAAGTLKVQGIRISEVQEQNNVLFREFEYELNFRPETWRLFLLDAGFQEIVGSNKRRIYLDDGSRPSVPQALNGFGVRHTNPTPFNAVFLPFDVYPAINLSLLPGVF